MGTAFSNRGDNERRDDPETVFIVPGHLNLSLRQMDVILRAGQQPGVPFRLGAQGAQRPQGNRVKVNYAENLISMQKNSLRITECESNIANMDSRSNSGRKGYTGRKTEKGERGERGERGEQYQSYNESYTVSFNYDSAVPAVVRIFIGATDKTVPQQIRAEGASLILGPFKLVEGKNRHWSSKLENCYIDERHLTTKSVSEGVYNPNEAGRTPYTNPAGGTGGTGGAVGSGGAGNQGSNPGLNSGINSGPDVPSKTADFDLMVCLSPVQMASKSCLFSAQPKQKEGAWLMQKRGYGLHLLPPTRYSESTISTLSGRSNPNSEGRSGGRQSQGDNSPMAVSDCDADAEMVLDRKARKKPSTPDVNSQKSTSSSIVSVDNTTSQRTQKNGINSSDVVLAVDYGKQSVVICEVSYLKVTEVKTVEVQRTPSVNSVQHENAVNCQYNVIDKGDREPTGDSRDRESTAARDSRDRGDRVSRDRDSRDHRKGKESREPRERRDREGKEGIEARESYDNSNDLESDPRSSSMESGGLGSSKSSKQFDVKCVMQRVQMTTGVFLTQDIYGMDHNRIEEDTPPTDEEDPAAAGDSPAPATTPGGITLDSDAIECVICLTDNRIIAVYPCRHMCLCASCAEVLPSQGNKCPICRRVASLLLKINPKGGCEDPTI